MWHTCSLQVGEKVSTEEAETKRSHPEALPLQNDVKRVNLNSENYIKTNPSWFVFGKNWSCDISSQVFIRHNHKDFEPWLRAIEQRLSKQKQFQNIFRA